MAYGVKTGGRKKGVKNKRTRRIESAARRLLDDAKDVLGDLGAKLFEGDAPALNGAVRPHPRIHIPVDEIIFKSRQKRSLGRSHGRSRFWWA
jgi:hypothetical protein